MVAAKRQNDESNGFFSKTTVFRAGELASHFFFTQLQPPPNSTPDRPLSNSQ